MAFLKFFLQNFISFIMSVVKRLLFLIILKHKQQKILSSKIILKKRFKKSFLEYALSTILFKLPHECVTNKKVFS